MAVAETSMFRDSLERLVQRHIEAKNMRALRALETIITKRAADFRTYVRWPGLEDSLTEDAAYVRDAIAALERGKWSC